MRNFMICFILAISAFAFTGCTTTREQVEEINAKLVQVEHVLAIAKDATPALEQGLADAEEYAKEAKAKAEEFGSETMIAMADKAQEMAASARQALENNAGIIDAAQNSVAILREQAENIKIGDPWWLTGIKIGLGLLAGGAGAGIPALARVRGVASALSETVNAVQVCRKDPNAKLDEELAKAQSAATKAQVLQIKAANKIKASA